MSQLRTAIRRAYIIAHKENVIKLRSALEADGFDVEEVRGPYTPEQSKYSLQMRCLVNHANAWRIISAGKVPAIVLEADFVPVRGFAQLPLPFPYTGGAHDARFGWLYSGGSILYGFDEHGYPHGHGNTTVAYALTPKAARSLIVFFEREVAADGTGTYRMWDTYIGIYMRREAGILNHIPIYQYGEHGGLQNEEHRRAGIRGWHQADVLWRELCFLPNYANGWTFRYRIIRVRGWLRGIARLVTLRYWNPRFINSDTSRGLIIMAIFTLSRMFRAAFCFERHIDEHD
jgi:hypothetical protein